MKVNDIFLFLNRLFPTDTARSFDNVGLLIGDIEADVKRVLIALDCTLETVENAVRNECELIITHHPVIFSPLKNILANSVAFEVVKNNLSVISMHTNLDVGDNGINDVLCETLSLANITPFTAPDGYVLKYGTVPPTKAESFANNLKNALGGRIKFVDGGKSIQKVLVCSGSGGDYITEAINSGFDALVAADIKHHQFLEAKDNGVSLFDAGHFETEDIVVEHLKQLLSTEFKDAEFTTFHPENIQYV